LDVAKGRTLLEGWQRAERALEGNPTKGFPSKSVRRAFRLAILGNKWMLTQKGVRLKLSKRIGFVSFLGQIAMKKGNKSKEIQGKAVGMKFA
jgi:hypothetical protein